MSDQKSILKSTILKYGLIYGGISVAFAIMLFIMKMHYQGGSLQQWTGLIIMVGSITFAQIAYRKQNDGSLNLSEAMKVGLGVTIVGILIAIVYGWFQATILDPNQIEKATEFALKQATDQNPEMTDEMIAMAQEWIEWGTSPAISTAFALGFGLIFGGIVSLITGLIVKRSGNGSVKDEDPNAIGEFGLVKTNPISVNGVINIYNYLDQLTYNNQPTSYYRTTDSDNSKVGSSKPSSEGTVWSTHAPNIKGNIDVFNIYDSNNKKIAKIYLNGYSSRTSKKVPKGFDSLYNYSDV